MNNRNSAPNPGDRLQTRVIRVSSVLPAPLDEIWEKLQRLDTLKYIASPFVSFEAQNEEKTLWNEGETFFFTLKLFGLFSLGTHTIRIMQFDKTVCSVFTNESNKSVPVWNHLILLEKTGEKATRYTDEVVVCAGWKTILVWGWGVIFYRHRQRKWRKLLRDAVPPALPAVERQSQGQKVLRKP
jgi:ligand-binding SRPBCC domain-containing protein